MIEPSLLGSPGVDMGASYMLQGLGSYLTSQINYDILNLQAHQKEIEADALELQVEQEANNLRKQFIEAAGDFEYGAARRGVKVGEGNVSQNIEQSAKAVSNDIQTAKGNVKFKQDYLKSDAGILRQGANSVRLGGLLDAVGSFSKAGEIYNKDKKKKILGTSTESDLVEKGKYADRMRWYA